MPPDWRTWTFSEEICMKRCCDLESTCSSIFEGSVECLSFDKFPIVLHPKNASLFPYKIFSDQCLFQEECVYQTLPTEDEQVVCYQPLMDLEVCIRLLISIQIFYPSNNCEGNMLSVDILFLFFLFCICLLAILS